VNVAVFGGFDRRPLAAGWKRETLIGVLGGGTVDLTEAPPEGTGVLTAVALLGLGLFGGRTVKVTGSGGPAIRLRAYAIFGGVEVREPKPDAG
jgi:hypothetical protein